MKMTGTLKDLTVNRDGTQNVTVTVNTDFARQYDALKGQQITVEITKASKKRSLDANRFLWALCSDIGKALTPPVEKLEIYQRAVKAAGVYFQTEIPLFKLDEVRRRWTSTGDGWLFEVVDNGRIGHKLVHMYFGTSSYTVDEMKFVLDWLVDQCRQMEIPIPLSAEEEERILKDWGRKHGPQGSNN